MRRYAASGRQADLEICSQLLQLAPNAEQRALLVEAFVKTFEGRARARLAGDVGHRVGEVARTVCLAVGGATT